MASEAQVLAYSVGYFITVGVLLGLAGIGTVSIEIPDIQTGGETDPGARVECGALFQWFCDLGSFVIHVVVTIGDVLVWAGKLLYFFFQILTFQLPVPFWLNSIIVLPPAVASIYIGWRLVRGGG